MQRNTFPKIFGRFRRTLFLNAYKFQCLSSTLDRPHIGLGSALDRHKQKCNSTVFRHCTRDWRVYARSPGEQAHRLSTMVMTVALSSHLLWEVWARKYYSTQRTVLTVPARVNLEVFRDPHQDLDPLKPLVISSQVVGNPKPVALGFGCGVGLVGPCGVHLYLGRSLVRWLPRAWFGFGPVKSHHMIIL